MFYGVREDNQVSGYVWKNVSLSDTHLLWKGVVGRGVLGLWDSPRSTGDRQLQFHGRSGGWRGRNVSKDDLEIHSSS